MHRILELEVYSPAEIVQPDTFFADVETIGNDILGKSYAPLLRYSGGETTQSRENGLTVEPPEKLKFYYVSRVVPHNPENALELATCASLLIEGRRLPGTIGGIDIIRPMVEIAGVLDADDRFCEVFHQIDKISSQRYPGQTVLALTQLPGDSSRVKPMTVRSNELIDEEHLSLFESEDALRLMASHGIAGCLPFARVKDRKMPEELINEAIHELTTNTLRNNVHVRIGPINHKMSES